MFTRRVFLGSSALLASELFGATAGSPTRDLEKLADSALREARKLKASYCDIRINRYRNQDISLADVARAWRRQDPGSAGRLRRNQFRLRRARDRHWRLGICRFSGGQAVAGPPG